MRGLLPFYRGLYTLSNRQASRKAGIVGSRCGLCGTQSNSKVRFELLLLLLLRALANNMSLTLITRRYFVCCSLALFFLLQCIVSTWRAGLLATFSAVDALRDETTEALTSGAAADVARCIFAPPPTMRKTTTDTLCSFFVLISPRSRGGKNFEVWDTVRLIVIC